MAPRVGSRKAGTGPGSLGGKVKQPGGDKVMFAPKATPPKAPTAKKPMMGPAFKKGGKVCCK